MKKILFLFILLSSLAFGITDFPSLNWGMNPKTVEIFYPNLKKEVSIYPNTKQFSKVYSNSQISKTVFYFINDELFKIDVYYDKNEIRGNDVKNIFSKLKDKFGNPVSKEPIYEKLGNITLTGNKITFNGGKDTSVAFKGVDTNSKGKLIDSNLILEYMAK
ncbi:hypothetical protein [Cetobacterium sp. SF1]|uniref:hypothetical protein n=1 Tax=Cetobacterium sp. SF1 TaxID=3417654 RepID=UPI003CF1C3B9